MEDQKVESSSTTSESMSNTDDDSVSTPNSTISPAWNKLLKISADMEPVTASGIAVVIFLILFSVFGRLGCLVIGLILGLFLHAGLENKRDWKETKHFWKKHEDWEELDDLIKTNPAVVDERNNVLPPQTNTALRYFWDLLIRDYVVWWYGPLSPDTDFPAACRRSLEYMASSFASHLYSRSAPEVVTVAIMSASTTLTVFFRELRASTESSLTVDEYLRAKPESALAQMVDENFQQQRLRQLAAQFVKAFAKRSDAGCEAATLFAREMLAMQIFYLTAQSCSTSSYINWYIVESFKDAPPDTLTANKKVDRPKEAEEAMAQAVREAEEMTNLLKAEEARDPSSTARLVTSVINPSSSNFQSEDPRTSTELLVDSIMSARSPSSSTVEDPKTVNIEKYQHVLQEADIEEAEDIYPSPPSIQQENSSSSRESFTNEIEQPRPAYVPYQQTPPNSQPSSRPSSRPSSIIGPQKSSENPSFPVQPPPPHETLKAAKITLVDLSENAGRGKPIRSKTTLSYMITIEPTGARVPGWVTMRQFVHFETLHDVLKRLAVLAGISSFPQVLPDWKGKENEQMTSELEDYLQCALSSRELADSEAMKRFFGKEITEDSTSAMKWKTWPVPLKGVGGGVRDAMMSSREGSRTILAAAWGGVGNAASGIAKNRGIAKRRSGTAANVPNLDSDTSYHSPASTHPQYPNIYYPTYRDSLEQVKQIPYSENPIHTHEEIKEEPNFDGKISSSTSLESSSLSEISTTPKDEMKRSFDGSIISTSAESTSANVINTRVKPSHSPALSITNSISSTSSRPLQYISPPKLPAQPQPSNLEIGSSTKADQQNALPLLPNPTKSGELPKATPQARSNQKANAISPPSELSNEDVQLIIDISFQILSDFYALSPSVWTFRRSLLNMLKSLLLRNGANYLSVIRIMLQNDLINKCLTSDEWIAGQVKMITAALWPVTEWPELDDELYKRQAKELFITRAVSDPLKGLMGGVATQQALEVVFEALQNQKVAKGILVALMCDILRAVQL